MLKYVLLGGLSYQPLTGYQLKQFVDRSARHFWHAQASQIYRTLDALDRDGMLTSMIEEQHDRPDRRLYQLTPAGREDLRAWLTQPMTEIAPTKDALLVRLFFSAQIEKAVVLTQLRLQQALHQRQLERYRTEIVAQIQAGAARPPAIARDALLWDCARRQGEISEEAYLRWLDETIRRIEAEF